MAMENPCPGLPRGKCLIPWSKPVLRLFLASALLYCVLVERASKSPVRRGSAATKTTLYLLGAAGVAPCLSPTARGRPLLSFMHLSPRLPLAELGSLHPGPGHGGRPTSRGGLERVEVHEMLFCRGRQPREHLEAQVGPPQVYPPLGCKSPKTLVRERVSFFVLIAGPPGHRQSDVTKTELLAQFHQDEV